MRYILISVIAVLTFVGCASGSQTVQGPDGWRWNSSWSALGGASIQEAAQQFDGELIAEEGSLAITLKSGQQVSGAVSPEVKAEIVKVLGMLLTAP